MEGLRSDGASEGCFQLESLNTTRMIMILSSTHIKAHGELVGKFHTFERTKGSRTMRPS